jgi:hypothetical protein
VGTSLRFASLRKSWCQASMTERAGAGVQPEEALKVFFEGHDRPPCVRVETWGKRVGSRTSGPGSSKGARFAHGALWHSGTVAWLARS